MKIRLMILSRFAGLRSTGLIAHERSIAIGSSHHKYDDLQPACITGTWGTLPFYRINRPETSKDTAAPSRQIRRECSGNCSDLVR